MTLIEQLNIKETRLTKSGYESEMILGNFHMQPFGLVNGGAILAFAEITAGQASNLLGKGRYLAVGQTITAHHLKKKEAKGRLFAIGELLHQGKSTHVWGIQIMDDEHYMISNVTVVNAIVMDPEKFNAKSK